MPVFFSFNFLILQKWWFFFLGDKIYTKKHIFPIFFSKIHKIMNQNDHLLILYTSIWKEEISIPPFFFLLDLLMIFYKIHWRKLLITVFLFLFPSQFSDNMSIVQQNYFIFHICAKFFTQNLKKKKKFVIEWPKNNIHLSFLSYKETWLTWSNHLCCCWSNF